MTSFKLTSKNLVQSWLQVELEFKERKLANVLRELNNTFGTNYTNSRIREWEIGIRGRGNRLPSEIRNYMLKVVIGYVFYSSGINLNYYSNANIDKIAEQLT
jgi:hypothetical protein